MALARAPQKPEIQYPIGAGNADGERMPTKHVSCPLLRMINAAHGEMLARISSVDPEATQHQKQEAIERALIAMVLEERLSGSRARRAWRENGNGGFEPLPS